MQIVINGVGGQGVLFLSKILIEAALNKGEKVLASETIGMAQRGGSVISFIKIGKQYNSPMVIPGDADIVICLQEQELNNSKGYLKKNGLMYINSKNGFDATSIAVKENYPSMANIIFLGYLAKDKNFPFNENDILPILPEKSKHFFRLGNNQCSV